MLLSRFLLDLAAFFVFRVFKDLLMCVGFFSFCSEDQSSGSGAVRRGEGGRASGKQDEDERPCAWPVASVLLSQSCVFLSAFAPLDVSASSCLAFLSK